MPLSPDFFNPVPDINNFNGTTNRSRVGGSGFTVFTWQNQPITFARQISHQSPAPVGPGTTPIHPLDSQYPVELVTPMALTMGTLVLELYEVYGENVWQRLAGLNGGHNDNGPPVDLGGIFQAVANSPTPIHIFRVIRPPRIRGRALRNYTMEFHNCVVSALDDGETIEVGTMEVLKRLTVNYAYVTRGGKNNLINSTQNIGAVGAPPGTSF